MTPCTKKRHPSREMAEAYIAYSRKRHGEPKRRFKMMEAYYCQDCGYFHIGHNKWKRFAKEN